MTIASENRKTYRQAMDVVCGIDTNQEQPTVIPSVRYGDGDYDQNMRAGNRGLSIKLMDLAGDGFLLDGTHQPIRTTAEATDFNSSIIPSYKGCAKYGVIAKKPANAQGYTSANDIDFNIVTLPGQSTFFTAHLRDSEGNVYRVTGTSQSNLLNKILSCKIAPNSRLYVDRITRGKSWQWTRSQLINCNLNLRGVDTTPNDPELQMSDIEINGIIDERTVASIKSMNENSPIWYIAGYYDDVTPVRRFYLSEGITVKNNIATVKGYDATKYLEAEHHGVVSAKKNGFCYGRCIRTMARRCYAILGRGLIYNHKTQFARNPVNNIKGIITDDTRMRYMSMNGFTRRAVIAAHCNLMRSASGGYKNSAIYCDYVDAGLPTFYAGTKPIGLSKTHGNEWNLSLNEVSDYEEEAQVDIAKISAQITYRKRETDENGKIKYTSYYAESVTQGDVKWINTEEPYTSSKFKKYKSVERVNEAGNKKWVHSKIGNLHRVMGHYYPDKNNFGWSCFDFKIKALRTAKQRIIGVRNVATQPPELGFGLPNFEYEDGKLTYTTGKNGDTIEFPDIFHTKLEQTRTNAFGDIHSMWYLFLKQLGDRSNVIYRFHYRGNPKMQPRDVIHFDYNGTNIDMTIDNITIEHSEGGLTTQIECRGGII